LHIARETEDQRTSSSLIHSNAWSYLEGHKSMPGRRCERKPTCWVDRIWNYWVRGSMKQRQTNNMVGTVSSRWSGPQRVVKPVRHGPGARQR